MKARLYRLLFLAFSCGLIAFSLPLVADVLEPVGDKPTQAGIDAGRKSLESDTGLDEVPRQKALEQYAKAEQWLREATVAAAERARLAETVRTGPERVRKLRARSAEPSGEDSDKKIRALVASADLPRLEAAVREEQAILVEARKTYDRQVNILSDLTLGTRDISQEIDDKKAALEKIAAELNGLATEEPSPFSRARQVALKARKMLYREELSLLGLRQDNHNLLVELAQRERDQAQAQGARQGTRINALDKAAGALRGKQMAEARQEAVKDTAQAAALPEALRAIADETTRYRLELEELAEKEKTVSGALTAAKADLDRVAGDLERLRQRMAVVGTSRAMGEVLRARRATLPSPRGYRKDSRERGAELGRAIDRQIHIDEQLHDRETANDAEVRLLEEIDSDLREPEDVDPEEKAKELLQARRDALNELQKVYGIYIGEVTALELAEKKRVSVAESYVEYINDQLIRIPDPGFRDLDPKAFPEALGWLFSPANWRILGADILALAGRYPVPVLLLAGSFFLFLGKRKQAEAKLMELSHDAGKIREYAFSYFLQAVGLTALLAVWPLWPAGVGYALTLSPSIDPFTLGIAWGLISAGLIGTGGLFLLRINLPDGLGGRHLRWSPPIREALLEELRWALPTVVALGVFLTIATPDSAPAFVWPIGRVAFVALMAVLLVLAYRLFHAGGQLMTVWRERVDTHAHLLARLHFFWFPLLLSAPIGLGILSIAGYRTLSGYLLNGAEMTVWFFIGLFLAKEFLLRYLYIAERRLRYEEAVKKREELRAQRAREEEEPEGRDDSSALSSLVEIPEPDFEELGEQARRLIHGGFLFCAIIGTWFIWSDLVLSLGILNDPALSFHGAEAVNGIARDVPITLGGIIRALLLLVITVLAAKNIPGVLEITVLQRLELEPGGRYAFTTLTQYLIVGAGVIAIFDTLGMEWSSIQWLVAALGVGLGFGLQEIVANFVSGIILLFERPIRIGDVVTIDNTTGVVSRIRIRATTIVNWDQQELLVPNKDLITGRLTNWTLSNKVNRILITVGIAYGADVALALRLLEQAAAENIEILTDPAPIGTFEGFGDNALTLFLRCYIDSLDNFLSTKTALHRAINDKFNQAGISIAFPQRDIHLSTSRPLDVRMVSS
uniref:Potassium efflux system protein n=1 Tax=Candidatus Kentrum sp. DK TaxID=2126562 RepID=A0A450S260_9GAMM|nr:MAG: potassium efflux system protein [Candidatus Kentron sp. DK]